MFALLGAVACRTGYDPDWSRTVSPSGKPAFVIECSRTAWCTELAGELCPRGYAVFGHGSEHDYDPTAQAAQNLFTPAGKLPAYMGKNVRFMSIECADPSTQPSPPPRITVTKNAPVPETRRATSTEPGF